MRGRLAGGGGLTAACGKPVHLGQGRAAVLRTRVSGARLGVGKVSLLSDPADAARAHLGDALRPAAWMRVRDGLFRKGARSHLFLAFLTGTRSVFFFASSALGQAGGAA